MEEQITMFETNAEYEAFVEKFKPKLTTDDCYTPEIVYNAIRDYVVEKYHLECAEIIRPFYPGCDYKKAEYPEGCVVLDNPPFSIISQIVKWYVDRGIMFFLFAPGLTIFSAARGKKGVTSICTHAPITYANGAIVQTSFITNMTPGILVESEPILNDVIKKANEENTKQSKKEHPKYEYPNEVLTATIVNYMSVHGIAFKVMADDAMSIRALDAQKGTGKSIFGYGYLLSEKAAAEKAAAEKAAAEKTVAIRWQLSDREKEIINALG